MRRLILALCLLAFPASAQVCFQGDANSCAGQAVITNQVSNSWRASVDNKLTTLLSGEFFPSIFSATAITVTNTLMFTSSSLPTCNAATIGLRRSSNKACWCDGVAWRNIAPAATVSVLGVSVLVADGCP